MAMVFSQTLSICLFPRMVLILISQGELGDHCLISQGPAQSACEKQNGPGVEDWDFPAKSKPPARRLCFRFDQMFCHGSHCVRRRRRKAGENRLQRHRLLRICARPVFYEEDGRALCLGAYG
jgi:hypothetical protein